jgi:hypothetical protein
MGSGLVYVCIAYHVYIYVSLRWTKGGGFMNIFVYIFKKILRDLGQEAEVHPCSILGCSNFIPCHSPTLAGLSLAGATWANHSG